MYFIWAEAEDFGAITDLGLGHFQVLCPEHNEVMVISPLAAQTTSDEDTEEIHDCECVVDGCSQHYLPSYGYFTIARNDDH